MTVEHVVLPKKSAVTVKKASNYTVHPAPFPLDTPGSAQFNNQSFYAAFALAPLALMWWFGASLNWTYVLFFAVTAVPTYIGYMVSDSVFKNWAFNATAKVCFSATGRPVTLRRPARRLQST
jgi:hypothetical protein